MVRPATVEMLFITKRGSVMSAAINAQPVRIA